MKIDINKNYNEIMEIFQETEMLINGIRKNILRPNRRVTTETIENSILYCIDNFEEIFEKLNKTYFRYRELKTKILILFEDLVNVFSYYYEKEILSEFTHIDMINLRAYIEKHFENTWWNL